MVQGKDFVEEIWETLLKTRNKRLIRRGHELRLMFIAMKLCEMIRRKGER